jgi:ABC-type dipeptide/oligopeptide/nickel transport system permease component
VTRRYITKNIVHFLQKLSSILAQVLLSYTILFIVMRTSGGDPLARDLPLSTEAREAMARTLYLDRSLIYQYARSLFDIASLHWGYSFYNQIVPLSQVLPATIITTAVLAGLTFLWAVPLAIMLACSAFFSHPPAIRWTLTVIIYLIGSLPTLISAPILFFWASHHGLLDYGSSWYAPSQMLLILVILSLPHVGTFAKILYTNLRFNQMLSHFYQLKAMGFSKVQSLYIIRIELFLPMLKLSAASFAGALSGSVLVEDLFRIPGLGRLALEAILQRDYPLIMLSSLFFSISVILLSSLSQWLYTQLDPRTKEGLA